MKKYRLKTLEALKSEPSERINFQDRYVNYRTISGSLLGSCPLRDLGTVFADSRQITGYETMFYNSRDGVFWTELIEESWEE